MAEEFDEQDAGRSRTHGSIDGRLLLLLRDYQVQGVNFLLDNLLGNAANPNGRGCILADGVGLLSPAIYSLLCASGVDKAACRRALVVWPALLAANWR